MSTHVESVREQAQKRGEAIGGGLNVLAETLTGYEEEGIVQAFGHPWSSDALDTQTTLRAMVFVLKKREGLNHADAKDAVMQMTAKEVQDIVVAHHVEEVFPEEPVTEPGKDDSQPD